MTSEGVPSRLAVTGAGGFVGSRLVAALDGPVRCLVRKAVDYLPTDRQVEVDMLADLDALTEAFAGVTAVVHLAGHNEVVARQEPDRALAETALGARHVADAARAAGVERVVYVSTVHVYGPPSTDGEVLTEHQAPAPRSTYAIARLTCEHLLAQADLDLVVLRLSNALGAPADPSVDRWTLLASDLCRQAVKTGTMSLHSAGLQWRDFVDLGDVCQVIGASTDPARVAPGVYNLASGQSRTVRSVAGLVQDAFEGLTGTRPTLTAPDPDGPTPPAYRISVDRLTALGQRPSTPATASIEGLARFCLEHKDAL